MKTRRDFVKLAAGAGFLSASGSSAAAHLAPRDLEPTTPADDRATWCRLAERLARPILTSPGAKATAAGAGGVSARNLGCLLFGLAPWFEQNDGAEQTQLTPLASLARERIHEMIFAWDQSECREAFDPARLIDVALVAQALMRAPNALWSRLNDTTREAFMRVLTSTRRIRVRENHERLFAAVVEIALQCYGGRRDDSRLYEGLRRQHDGNGRSPAGNATPPFHWEVPHALVVQPMLLGILSHVAAAEPTWASFHDHVLGQFGTMAAMEERLVAPDGSYPSFASLRHYRCGIFQGLALASWRHALPAGVAPGQARTALTAVIRRSLEEPGAFDHLGCLSANIGSAPASGRDLSLPVDHYLCSTAFLPLGLARTDLFWTQPSAKTTWQQAWTPPGLNA